MENASKALMIAGGVLIAIIILAMFLMMFNRIASIEEEQEQKNKMEQLAAFNSEFEAFNKKVMYGTDVITLINKVAENNRKYSNNQTYKIIIKLNDVEVTSSSHLIGTDEEQKVFECIGLTYNTAGRVCQIEIKTKI